MVAVIDENMAGGDSAFAAFGDIIRRPGRTLGAKDVVDADVLFVRSVTRVDEQLLAGSRVRFVGSATIGTDHVDIDWLSRQGIGFAHAPGCNAGAVADWVVAVLAALTFDGRYEFGRGRVGIVGAGSTGSRVAQRLRALGHDCLLCDPPRAEQEGAGGFVDLGTALSCDVVTLHVPLSDDGPDATRGLIDAAALARIPPGGVLLNAARGGVIDEDDLGTRLDDGPPLVAAIDTWAGEPAINTDLLARVDLATPHIAGYSLEGKLRGTAMVTAAAARFLGIAYDWNWQDELPPAPVPGTGSNPASSILAVYDPRLDDTRLRALLCRPAAERPPAFDALRRDYPVRREFASFPAVSDLLRAAGFGDC